VEPETAAGRMLDAYAGPAYRHIIVKAEADAKALGAKAERERLRATIHDHWPYTNPGHHFAIECANVNCAEEPYDEHLLALLSEPEP
jgi:hypothetical protein